MLWADWGLNCAKSDPCDAGQEGWRPTAFEALEAGLVHEVVSHDRLSERAQEIGEEWAREGKRRWIEGKVSFGVRL